MNRLPLAVLTAFTTLALATPVGAVVAPDERPLPNIDVRTADGGPTTVGERRARVAFERALGDEGVVSNDRVTGGVRMAARTDGFLTGRRSAAPTAVALDFVRARPDVFGLDGADLDRLRLTSRDRSPDGVTHLAYAQTYLGVAAYDNVLLANVGDGGRLLNVGGAAVGDLRVPSVTPDLTAPAALVAAKRIVGGRLAAPRSRQSRGPERATRFSNGDTARLTLFNDGTTTRLAWLLEVTGEHEYVYELVVDATSGRVLKRRSLTEFVDASVYRNHPGAPVGGAPVTVDLAGDGTWLNQSAGGTRLSGNNAHAYVDVDTTDGAPPPAGGDLDIAANPGPPLNWTFPRTTVLAGPSCPASGCTWNSGVPNSRTTNRGQATTQLFYFVNTFHDHLAQGPINFTHAAGNFEFNDADGAENDALGNDPVMAETDNYLNPDAPATTSTNNASMTTRRDGTSPRLEMFLFTNPSLNSADTADVVYHEYAHGLTNRSVGSGVGLDAQQSRAMGEGWSDWYALDYLEEEGLRPDAVGTQGEMKMGNYLLAPNGFRTQGTDCRVGAPAGPCPGKPGLGHAGGYVLGDMGTVGPSGFAVHDDGEIWAQTLWDVRRRLRADLGEVDGTAAARELITSGLRLAPNNPSFLEARDAILLADRNLGGDHYDALWAVFAERGMGYNAVRTSSAVTSAISNTDLPPRLVHESTTLDDGPPPGANDDDDVPEPGETVRLTEELRNPHLTPNIDVDGVLSSTTPGVTVTQDDGTWPDIAARTSESNTAPFAVTIASPATCETTASLNLAMTIGNPNATFSVPLRMPIGSKSSDDVPKAIPTAPNGIASLLIFNGSGPVNDLEVRIPRLAHTWVGDLVVTLTNPDQTKTVTLVDRPGRPPGAPNTDFGVGGDDFVNVVLDDDAGTAIEDLPAANPSGGYTGRFRPNEPLSEFDTDDRQGTWTLRVSDAYPDDDSGTLYDWGIRPSGEDCPNRAPEAADDPYSVAGGQTLNVPGPGILANDRDPDGHALSADKLTNPAHGTATVNSNGSFAYTPVAGYRGPDSFTYEVEDDGGPPGPLTDTATVAITVGNSPPNAADDAYAVTAGSTLSGSTVLANDSDPNSGDTLSAVLAAPPSHGTLALAANGTFTYTPDAGFTGRDAFAYGASDGTLLSAAATVTLTVSERAVQPPPAPPPAPVPTAPFARAPAKLEVLRAGVAAGKLDVLASITTRATGTVRVRYRSAGATTNFTAPIRNGRISFRKALPPSQRSKPTGIFTLTYGGSTTVQPDDVTLRAARGKARLVRRTALIDAQGRLRVAGTITPRARGVVRIRYGYVAADGSTEYLSYRAKIAAGAWSLTAPLPNAAARAGGQLSIQFTGYEPLRIRGEQLAKAVAP